MTAHSNPTDFKQLNAVPAQKALRPHVIDHFWGYEVGANEQTLDAAVLMRLAVGIGAVAVLVALIGIWLVPSMAFLGAVFGSKALTTVIFLGLGVVLARIAARGTKVRVQIDTANGELREVVDGPLGSVIVLAHYGFDAIESVGVVTSTRERSFGQVVVTVDGVGAIPLGTGALVMLQPLLERVATDCGVEIADTR